jgi:hypothetical protein
MSKKGRRRKTLRSLRRRARRWVGPWKIPLAAIAAIRDLVDGRPGSAWLVGVLAILVVVALSGGTVAVAVRMIAG